MNDTAEDIRKRIIEAAKVRFEHFGYNKNSMAEIAEDCDMSPGNLYRYFRNKLNIAESLMRIVHDELNDTLTKAVEQDGLSASQQLETLIIAELKETWRLIHRFPTLREPAHQITAQRPMLWYELKNTVLELKARIIRKGNENGEFNVPDPLKAAALIRAATFKYFFPQTNTPTSLEELVTEARGVVNLLITGLRR